MTIMTMIDGMLLTLVSVTVGSTAAILVPPDVTTFLWRILSDCNVSKSNVNIIRYVKLTMIQLKLLNKLYSRLTILQGLGGQA